MRRFLRPGRMVGWAVGACLILPPAGQAGERPAAAPTMAATQAAGEKLREVLQAAPAGAALQDHRQQARRLMDLQATYQPADPAGRYVLLQAAAEQATAGGDAELLGAAMKALAAGWEGDWLARRMALLKAAGTGVRWQGRLDDVIGPCVEAVAEARAAGRYQAGMEMCDALAAWGKPLEDTILVQLAARLRDELAATAEMHAGFEKAQAILKSQPGDPAACTAAGRYLAFCTARWDDGMALLAKGGEAALKAQAERDAKAGMSSQHDLDTAAGWAELAGKHGEPIRGRCMRRAGECYDLAIRGLDDAARAQAVRGVLPLHMAILSDRLNRLSEWEVVLGQWTTTPSGRLLGTGESYLRFRHKLPGTVFVEFHVNVLDGMRPRVHFEETKMFIGNEGFRREFWPHEGQKVWGLWEPYANGRAKRIGVYLAGGKFEWYADGRCVGRGELSKSSEQITLAIRAGDGWCKGRALYWGFRVLSAPPADMTPAAWHDAREEPDVQEEVGP
jgi:hypothetical protein